MTGASYGLGAAIAERLASDGFDLVLTDLSVDGLATTAAAVEARGRTCLRLPLDLRDQSQIEEVVAQATRRFAGLNTLVNNAGAASPRKPALALTRDDWTGVVDVSLTGSFFMTQAFARAASEGGGGSVIMIASTHGLVGYPGHSAYGIAKAGVAHMTRALALEWAQYNIRVNAVAPGTVETETRRAALADPQTRQRLMDRIPLGRFAVPADIAGAVSFLASDDAAFVTGHTLVVDGGVTAA